MSGLVHRIVRACSNWKNFHNSITKAKMILQNNQSSLSFVEPIIDSLMTEEENTAEDASADLEVQLVQLNHCDGEYSNY